MEITNVETAVLGSAVEAASLPAQVGARELDISSVVVRVHTDEGITGFGESFYRSKENNMFLAESIDAMSRHIVGKDPEDVKAIWHELYLHVKRAGAYGALSAIDEALWDIKGKDAGKPVYQLLGGQTNEVKAYATFPVDKTAEELIDYAGWLSDKGFQAMKIGAGYGIKEDRHRIKTIMDNIPDDFGLAIDANTSYSYNDAAKVAKTASEYEVEWFEEPINHMDIEGQAELNRKFTVPISGYQTHTPHYPALEHLKAKALDIYQPSVDYVGGITGAMRVAGLVEAFDKELVPHALGPAINYAASLHVAAASRQCRLIEFAVLDDDIEDPGTYIAGPYIENRDAIHVDDGGTIEPPQEPGLGVRIDEDVFEEYRVD